MRTRQLFSYIGIMSVILVPRSFAEEVADVNMTVTDEGECATEPSTCELPAKDKKKPAERHKEVMDNQLKRIGMGVLNGKLTSEEQEQVRASRQKINDFFAEAMKDKKLSKEERVKLRELHKQNSQEIFALKSNQIDLDRRLERMKSQLAAGIAKGRVSEEEKVMIEARIKTFEENLAKAKVDGLTPEEHVALVKESNKAILASEFYSGKDKKQWRKITNDMMHELGMDLGTRIGKCWEKGKLTDEERDALFKQLMDIYALNEKYQTESVEESKKLNKLDKKDKKDLQAALKKIRLDLKEACGSEDDKPEVYSPIGTVTNTSTSTETKSQSAQ